MSGFERVEGELLCDRVSLAEVAERHGTPLFVYSRAAIEEANASNVETDISCPTTGTIYVESPLVVEADRRQIEQVLLNMYINAWQAMPDGGDLYLETRLIDLDETRGSTINILGGSVGSRLRANSGSVKGCT